jgi:protein-tyrosine phosphatase
LGAVAIEDRGMIVARTSLTHPLQIAEVRASPAHGRIGITFCPGKQDMDAMSGAWARDLSTDLDAIVAWGATALVTLVEPSELSTLKVADLGPMALARGLDWRHLPIPDFSVPSPAFERRWLADGHDIRAKLRAGEDVVVHCKGGLGRAGMIAARLLVELGVEPEAAIRTVRAVRKGAIETHGQLALVRRTVAIPPDGLDVAALRKVGGQLGSNPGGIHEDDEGRRYYVKTPETPALARNERLAAALYRLAGAPTLVHVPVVGGNHVATVFVDLAKRSLARFDNAERRQARRWFAVHAWTANWDAVGFDGDNQGVVDGVATTLDVGGALEFRAQGDPKGDAFGRGVGEIDSLRQNPDNPHATRLFGDMTPAEISRAIAVVTRIPDVAIRRVVAEGGGSPALADKLVARKADLNDRAGRMI